MLQLRVKRQRMVLGFIQHLFYLLLLVVVIYEQGGASVGPRYSIVQSIEGYLKDLRTSEPSPHHMELDKIESIGDFWYWSQVRRLVGTLILPPCSTPPSPRLSQQMKALLCERTLCTLLPCRKPF